MPLRAGRAVALVRTALPAHSLAIGEVSVSDSIFASFTGLLRSLLTLSLVAAAAVALQAVYPHAHAQKKARARG